jgi:hypothetical protein
VFDPPINPPLGLAAEICPTERRPCGWGVVGFANALALVQAGIYVEDGNEMHNTISNNVLGCIDRAVCHTAEMTGIYAVAYVNRSASLYDLAPHSTGTIRRTRLIC